MTNINTVLGPIESSKLGFTLSHEHICNGFGGSPFTFPEFLDREATFKRAAIDLSEAKSEGLHTIMDVAPHDQGRDIKLQQEVSKRSGVNIITCTGTWLDVPRFFEGLHPNKIADLYMREIEEGIEGTEVKASIIKVASDKGGVKPKEELVLRAAARASKSTGIPIMTHTWAPDRIGEEQVRILKEENLDMGLVCIGHSNDTTDIKYLTGLLDQGVWLGMDRHPGGGLGTPLWEERTQIIKSLIELGWGHRIMLAHDWDSSIGLHSSEFRAQREAYNPDNYLFITRKVLPYLKNLGATETDIKKLTVHNPQKYLEGTR
jgi:phosphotriesterase-related protein